MCTEWIFSVSEILSAPIIRDWCPHIYLMVEAESRRNVGDPFHIGTAREDITVMEKRSDDKMFAFLETSTCRSLGSFSAMFTRLENGL
jgi:hypothetical protein